jgi:hypothetical protein
LVKGNRRKPQPKPNPPKKRRRKRKSKFQNDFPPEVKIKKKKKRGPPSYAQGKALFRRAGYAAKLNLAVDKNLSMETHAKRRLGFNLMWKFAPRKCEQLGFGKPGSFSKSNGHNGECWGWKKECTMTDVKAGKILLHLVTLGTLTMSQLEVVRKSLAYSYQLRGNIVTRYQNNWAQVGLVWKTVNDRNCAPTKSTRPTRIPEPEHQITAFTGRWDPRKNKLSLLKWIICRRAAYDTLFCGHRPNKDMQKMKESRRHKINTREGWSWTDFVNGRSKLSGPKKNSRPWKQFAVCWCEGGKHKSPTMACRYNIDEAGNPRNGKPGFDERCITAGFEFTNLWMSRKNWRRYPNLKGTGRGKSMKGRIGDADVGQPKLLALEYMRDQGLPTFDANSGRKALAKMLAKLNIPYEVGFEMHGDTFSTWESRYQNGCRREREEFTRRTQSEEIDIATKGLRQLSHWIGLGSKKPTMQLSLLERQNDFMLRAMGLRTQADELLLGLNAQVPVDYRMPQRGEEPIAVKPESVVPVKPEPKKEEED